MKRPIMKKKGAYQTPLVEVVNVRIEEGFAASGEGQIEPGGDDGELTGDGY